MAIQIDLPGLGENVDSGTVTQVLVHPGDMVKKEQGIIEIETGKATVEVPSPAAGKVLEVRVKVGEVANVGDTLLVLEPLADAAEAGAVAPAPPLPRPPSRPEARPATSAPTVALKAVRAQEAPQQELATVHAMAAPSVRQFAREIGVDVDRVEGSGPGGRVSQDDVKRFARQGSQVSAAVSLAAPPDFSRWGTAERESLSQVRLLTAEAMARSWATIPHVMLEREADSTALETFRTRHKDAVEKAGGKLTVTAILVKIVAAALVRHPRFNASLDLPARQLVLKKFVHVGVAADTPRGLLVPVIRDPDKKGIQEIAVELTALAEKARAGKLGPADLGGATFTVTNLGGMGVGHFTAIINPPEVAILAVGKAEGGRIPLSLSIDHRVLDGADGARFLSFLVEAIESPFVIAL